MYYYFVTKQSHHCDNFINLLSNYNFLFKFRCCQADVTVYVHIVDHVMLKVYI